MSSNKYGTRTSLYIADIHDNLALVLKFTRDFDYQDFIGDDRTVYAVARCFQIVGDAVKKLPDDFREKHADILWAEMARFRDKIIHDYDNVDLSLVWSIITQNVPNVLKQIETLLPKD
jgi:uncharacterized protein with HEPN domain